jgi:hypothetical protein
MAKKAAKRRRKPIDPQKMLISVCGFREAAKLLDGHEVRHIFSTPMIVNETFALELAIKTLHRIRRRYATGHDIENLFEALSAADQSAIEVHYEADIRKHEWYEWAIKRGVLLDSKSVLVRSKDTFAKFRYRYEESPPSTDSKGIASNAGAGSLTDAIVYRIIDIKPAWRRIEVHYPGDIRNSPSNTIYLCPRQ